MPRGYTEVKVCMFVVNNCKRDARVLREAKTLSDAGHDVRIIAVLDKQTKSYEEKKGFRIIRVALNPIHRRIFQIIRKVGALSLVPFDLILRWIRGTPALARRQVDRSVRSDAGPIDPSWESAPRRVARRLYLKLVSISLPFNRTLSWIDYYWRSWKVIRDEPADVYHSHDLSSLPIGYMAKRRTNGKLVYDSHELFTELASLRRLERPLFRVVERYLINRADEVITVCQSAATILSEKYRIALPNVVMNCPPRVGLRHGATSSLRQNAALADGVPIILYSGGFITGRALHNVVLSASYLNEGKIVFLGWGSIEQELKALVRDKMLVDRVLFLEPVPPEEVVEYIASASLGVTSFQFTSLNNYYATPNKLFEYIHAGLPVVGSNFPELKRVIEGYRLGKTFDPENPEDIASAINWVLSDKDRYEEMRRNALEAAKIFNWENESKKLLSLYEGLSDKAND